MQVKITNFTTLMQNGQKYNDQQRSFFKAANRSRNCSYVYRKRNGERLYLFAFDQTDLIHIGILGKLYGP